MEYFNRDLSEARNAPFILGIKISARTDLHWAYQPCPRGAQIVGVYLPDEVPLQYPKDCPDQDACCCTLRDFVLTGDDTADEEYLRARMIQRGMKPPPPREKLRELTPAEREAAEATARKALDASREKDKPLWRFVLGLFSNKS